MSAAVNMKNCFLVKEKESELVLDCRSWSQTEWEIYLSSTESITPEEEIYVGTANDLEQYLAKRKYKNEFFY